MSKTRKTEQEWQQLIADCKARPKGVRIPQWCEQQGISPDSYKYWKKKLDPRCSKVTTDSDIQFVPLSIPVHNRVSQRSADISIKYKDFEIVVSEQSSQTLLTRLLQIMRSSC